ncbi:integrase [Bifidobacterium lemurum]|uniref:Integrase n=1 Tax=Bifidobacterium lemurum TaxID=1603886 RepID=A0A261FVA6_9BIFI|nr:tyrosine-type recombinase/integrase [Bifidobacterium lemurum]OZG62696.1 integrase [Bifidobacterium lemurum]QOL34587.1 tyrosine-type recombinase/integrase [Bifidobacterium lemurum]
MAMKQFKFPSDWTVSAEAWLVSLRAAGRAESTISTRRRKLRSFAAWVGKPPARVTVEDCEMWLGRDGLAAETRKGIRATLAGYFQWAAGRGIISEDPTTSLPHIKQPRPHPHPCPDKVILAALGRATPDEVIMLRLGAECGLRRCEIARVHSDDVMDDLIGKSLIVRGKGDVQRIVPIADDLAREIASRDGWLLPGRWQGHVEVSYVSNHLTRLLGGPWTAHSLRHRYATTTYEATHDIYLVSRLLGHASVKTTMAYVAMPDSRLRAALGAVTLAG